MNLNQIHSPKDLIKVNSELPSFGALDLSDHIAADILIEERKLSFLGLDETYVSIKCLPHLYEKLAENIKAIALSAGFSGSAENFSTELGVKGVACIQTGLSSLDTRQIAIELYKHYRRYLRVRLELVKPYTEEEIG